MKAVVLAAGEGRRLWPLTTRRPKPMLPAANKPILGHILDTLVEAGITEVVLVVGYNRERIQSYVGDGDDWGLSVEYAIQDEQLGTGHAVQQAEPFVDGEFLVLNGDRIIDSELVRSVRGTADRGTAATVSVTRSDTPEQYGIAITDRDRLLRIEEKPVAPDTELINAGVYRFSETIFEALADRTEPTDGELRLPDALTALAADHEVSIVRHQGRWLDVSYPWDLLAVNDELLAPADRASEPAPSAVVAARCRLGAGTTVGPNTTIASAVSLGPNVSVGANAVVSNSVVMQDATIADGAVVRDCIVGENATIGPNTTVTGGTGTVGIGDTLHRGVPLGGVVGANTTVGGQVVLSPGVIVGDDVTLEDGTAVSGRIDSGTVVTR